MDIEDRESRFKVRITGDLEEVRFKMTEGNTPELKKYLSVQRRAHCLMCKSMK